jgi:hypothetical protein
MLFSTVRESRNRCSKSDCVAQHIAGEFSIHEIQESTVVPSWVGAVFFWHAIPPFSSCVFVAVGFAKSVDAPLLLVCDIGNQRKRQQLRHHNFKCSTRRLVMTQLLSWWQAEVRLNNELPIDTRPDHWCRPCHCTSESGRYPSFTPCTSRSVCVWTLRRFHRTSRPTIVYLYFILV